MKVLIALSLFASFSTAYAEDGFPELYCVSAKSYQDVNQINLFTNSKGTLRISLQHYAVSNNGGDAGLFDTSTLTKAQNLHYDKSTGVIVNEGNTIRFKLESDSISSAEANKILNADKGKHQDLENPSGFKVVFSKYYRGTMQGYNLPAKKGTWMEDLVQAFNAGVTEYVCGKRQDAKKAAPSIFDDKND